MSLTMESVLDRLQTIQNKQPAKQFKPVMIEGRTFRQCPKCGKQGWHPQAGAEICCGQAMALIEHPAMTLDEYARFIQAPNTCAKIGAAEVRKMMEREGIEALPDIEKAVTGDCIRPT